MSGTKRISALTELALGSVAEDDIMVIVDVSQASVTDKTKYVKVSSLQGAFLGLVAKTADYTVTQDENGKMIAVTSASPVTITVPSGLSDGFSFAICQYGTAQVTVAGSGTSIVNEDSYTKTSGQYAVIAVSQVASEVYAISGSAGA